jgi:hypothetical protein
MYLNQGVVKNHITFTNSEGDLIIAFAFLLLNYVSNDAGLI